MLIAQVRRVTGSQRARGAATAFVALLILTAMAHAVDDWSAAFRQMANTPPSALAGALGLLVIAGLAAMRSWVAALPDVAANTRDWGRVFYVGQLGKYMPGSLWAAAIQAQLARRLGAQPRQLLAGFVIAFGVSISCSALIGAPGAYLTWGWGAVVFTVLAAICGLGVLATTAQTARFTHFTRVPLRVRDVARSVAWSTAGWVLAGLHLSVLMIAMGAPIAEALLIAPAASALAVGAGSLAIFTPGGVGVRELVLMACLSSMVNPAQAAAAAVLSRLLYLAADLLLAASTISVPRLRKVFA